MKVNLKEQRTEQNCKIILSAKLKQLQNQFKSKKIQLRKKMTIRPPKEGRKVK